MLKLISFICLIPLLSQAQQSVTTKIEKVTLFLNGAYIERSAKIPIVNGKTELVFKGISPQIDKQSLQIKGEGKFTVLSVVHQLGNLLDKSKQEEISKIEAQKTLIEDKIKVEKNNLLVFKREEEMLLKNQIVGGTYTGMKANDLKESIDYQRIRMQEVLAKQVEFERNLRKLDEEIRKVNYQLTEINSSKDATMSEILVTVSAKENVPNAAFSISYFVQNAGWSPTYDFRVDKLTDPISITYKANVYQYSGEDWKDVKLSLSTANPRQNGVAPVLKNWFLGVKNDYSEYLNNINAPINEAVTEVRGKVIAKSDGEGLPGVMITLKNTSLGTQTDANGNFKINVPPNISTNKKVLICSFIGMKTQEVNISSNLIDIFMEDDSRQLEEVVVVGYGGKTEEMLQGRVAGISVRGNNSLKKAALLEIEEKEAPTSQSFDILIPYSIPSNGKVYAVEIKEDEIPATYEHFCVPKIDLDVFLNAKIIGWEKYKLLEGEASLFVDGTYLGKSKLNLSNKDTLNLSFGRDKNVLVTRTKLKDFQKKQLIGNYKSEQRAYEISVRNTKNEAINLVIEDQFPISKIKEVSVEDKDAPEAEINEETGKLIWKKNILPTKEHKFAFKYTIKSPKSDFVEAD
jgi:Domain of unknown function (DUF4139)/N-terminal domain of unknown function (DUF4140)